MRSDNVKKGPERAPNRSLFYALGYTPEELERPLIGVVSAYSEIVPGHMNLDKLADAVKAGIRMAGGTPVLIPAIGVCDGIAMGHIGMKYSLASRELICDSVETMCMAHQLDGLVLVPNCDKIVPGMLMGALRLNVPTVVCSGGPMLNILGECFPRARALLAGGEILPTPASIQSKGPCRLKAYRPATSHAPACSAPRRKACGHKKAVLRQGTRPQLRLRHRHASASSER